MPYNLRISRRLAAPPTRYWGKMTFPFFTLYLHCSYNSSCCLVSTLIFFYFCVQTCSSVSPFNFQFEVTQRRPGKCFHINCYFQCQAQQSFELDNQKISVVLHLCTQMMVQSSITVLNWNVIIFFH